MDAAMPEFVLFVRVSNLYKIENNILYYSKG